MKPKSYPPTDSAEQDSKTIFESLIDRRFVKPEIETRSTHPNIDGTIELTNESGVPIGKFDIQLKTLPKGQTSFSCDISLASYCQISTLPILLICVDSKNRRAYWKHINPHMPELMGKEEQKSFTVHFSQASDSIDQSGVYMYRWKEIALDYQKCIEKYPIVSSKLAEKLDLVDIEPTERELFQSFIDTINNLLDNDFIAVKELIFPGVWKLGVGIISSDQHHIQYQIYRIPYKEPSPLVCKLNRGSLFSNQYVPNAVTEIKTSKEAIIDLVKAGKEFVLEKVRKVVEVRLLPIYGYHLSVDTLFSFIDRYHPALGIVPEQDHYLVKDLSYALNQHLIKVCAAILGKGTPLLSSGVTVDLDEISHYLKENKVAPIDLGGSIVNFAISSENFPIRAAFDSLKYLVANEITEIDRIFGRRDQVPAKGTNWIWSSYSRQNEVGSVTRILEHSIEEYTAFVNGNHLKLPESPYLDPNVAIIYEYEPVGTTSHDGPGLNEYHVDNSAHTLPGLSVFVRDPKSPRISVSHNIGVEGDDKFYQIEFEGKVYKSYSISYGIADFFFHRTPLLNLIYKMLSVDLSKHYDMTLIHV